MRRSFLSRALRLALVSCAILLGGLVQSGTWALAAGGEAPSIGGVSAIDITEHSATLEVQINPEGLETTYEFWIEFANCQAGSCGSISVRPVGHGYIVAGSTYQTVRIDLSDLQPNYSYTYWVFAANSAGWVKGSGNEFKAVNAGGGSMEESPLPRVENTPTPFVSTIEPWVGEAAAAAGAHQIALVEEERKKREEANKPRTATPIPHEEWCGEEGVVVCGAEVVLASGSITVQSGDVALVKLTCAGKENCSGRLTVLAKTASRAKDGKKRSRAVTIGTAKFVVAAGKTVTVKVRLDTQGCHLLDTDHGRLAASVEILKSEPAPEQTQAAKVHLTQQAYRGRAKK